MSSAAAPLPVQPRCVNEADVMVVFVQMYVVECSSKISRNRRKYIWFPIPVLLETRSSLPVFTFYFKIMTIRQERSG